MIPRAVHAYCSALSTHISRGRPLTLIGRVDGANKVAKVVQVGLKITRYCACAKTFSSVKEGLRAIGIARDYMGFCDGLNKCVSSRRKTQTAYKTLVAVNEDRTAFWIEIANGVGGVAFIGMFVGGKPLLMLNKYAGINILGLAHPANIACVGLRGVSAFTKVTEKMLKIYQLNSLEEKYYPQLVPHSIKLMSKLSSLVYTSMYFGCWGSPVLNLSLFTFSAFTSLLSAHIKSGEDKKGYVGLNSLR